MFDFIKRIIKTVFGSGSSIKPYVVGSYLPPKNTIPPPRPEVWEEVCEKRKSKKKKAVSKKKKAKKLL